MKIPSSLRPLLHRKPIIWFLFMVVITVFYIVDISSNIEYFVEKIPVIGGLLGKASHFILDTRLGIVVFLVVGFLVLWLLVKAHLNTAREYQTYSPMERVRMKATVSAMVKKAGPNPKWEFDTENKLNKKLEVEGHVQSVRFIKPVEKVIRPNELPAFVSCERRFIRRLRNRILGIPQPRIVVNKFTENGIIFDEENTSGTTVLVEFYSGD